MDIVRKYMAFTHAGVRCHNTCNVGKAVKFRGWLLALLAMHLLMHPMTHAIAARVTPAAAQSVSIPASDDPSTARPLDNCDLCRLGHSVVTAPTATRVERVHPQWILVRIQSVSYESLRIATKLPSRAPPTL